MKRSTPSTIAGWILVAIGTLLVLENFDVLGSFRDAAISLVFAAGGIAFLAIFATRHEAPWTAIPGFTLVGLGAITGLQVVAPQAQGRLSGPLFLASISLGFWVVYLVRRAQWWPIIPGGVLLTLALVAGISPGTDGRIGGTIFWLGLALTFGLLYLVEAPHPRAMWPLFPAGVSLALAFATFGSVAGWMDILWPLALIAAGLVLVVRRARSQGSVARARLTDVPQATTPEAEEERYADQTLSQQH